MWQKVSVAFISRTVNSLDTFSPNNRSDIGSGNSNQSANSRHTPFSEKAQNARLALQNAARLWLYLPAYIALLVALGAACRALAHFITNNDVTVYLWATLILNSAVSIGVQCGSDAVRHWSSRVRVLFLILLPISALLFNATVLAPLEAEAEINATVSLVVGWTALLCVLLIGMRYGTNAKGAQRVPLSAPLVPALSLFGLLNSLSVDTLVQICFVIFVAAALYLIAYERLLYRVLSHDSSEVLTSSSSTNINRGALQSSVVLPFTSSPESLRAYVGRTATGYFLACCIWFAVFMGGAALFYYPVEAVIPRVLGVPLNAVRTASAALLDWRGSGATMELRGGNYPLSDREIMKLAIAPNQKGIVGLPDLWRGRIYDTYSDSRWSIDKKAEAQAVSLRLKRGLITSLNELEKQTLEIASSPTDAAINLSLVRTTSLEATVVPQRFNNTVLFFPGELTAIRGIAQLQKFPDGTYEMGSSFRTPSYDLRANLKQTRLSALRSAPGLSSGALKAWRSDQNRSLSLKIDADLKEKLAPILAQIKAAALSTPRGSFDTPQAKVNAIRDYLLRNCTYSLSSPLVPANQDAVIFFLTNSKTGACDMFASAMTLLLRASDVPARLATGYLQPIETSDESMETQPAPSGTLNFIVRERDAHAWVEYYIPGAGWLSYDPTQGTRTTDLPIEEQIASIFNLPNLHFDFKTLWLPALGLLLIAAGLGWSFFDFRSGQKAATPTEEELQRARIVESYERAVSLLKRRVPRQKSQTPLEYETTIQNTKIADHAKQEFAALTYLVTAARYGQQLPQLEAEDLQACLARLRRAL